MESLHDFSFFFLFALLIHSCQHILELCTINKIITFLNNKKGNPVGLYSECAAFTQGSGKNHTPREFGVGSLHDL